MAQLYEEEQTLPAKTHLFRIDNRNPESTSTIDYVTLTEHSDLLSINFHLSDEIGRIFWVNTKKVIETDPDDKTFKLEWVFEATDSDIVNVASEYVTGRGLYVSQWTVDSDDNALGKLARISNADTDVASSLSTYLTLAFSQNYSSECSGTVSVHSDSGSGQDMITLSYNY